MRGATNAEARPGHLPHRGRWVASVDPLLILLLTAILIWPLFSLEYSAQWGSAEGALISDIRFLVDHWPHPTWQPLWYGGTRFDYIYPPGVRYGSALAAKVNSWPIPRAYHFYLALLYCLGSAGVYLLARALFQSRMAGWAAALLCLTISPVAYLSTAIRDSNVLVAPSRLTGLILHGDGMHSSGAALAPIAVALYLRALAGQSTSWIGWAALALALTAAHDLYALVGALIMLTVVAWSWHVTHPRSGVWLWSVLLLALAYGLCAFWMVPSFLKMRSAGTFRVVEQATLLSPWILFGAALGFVLVAHHSFGGRSEKLGSLCAYGFTLFFAICVLGPMYLTVEPFAQSGRLLPELDLALVLLIVAVGRELGPPRVARGLLALIVVVAVSGLGFRYLAHPWRFFVPSGSVERRPEFRLQKWIGVHLPGSRIMAAGPLGFWIGAWQDIPQLDGASDEARVHAITAAARVHMLSSQDPDQSIAWMQMLGVDAVVVRLRRQVEQPEIYAYPMKFEGRLPVLYRDGEGTVLYGVPRRWKAIARVVDSRVADALPPVYAPDDRAGVGAYVSAFEGGRDVPVTTEWQNPNVLAIRTNVRTGESVVVQVSYDSGWVASTPAGPVKVSMVPSGLVRLDPPAGTQAIALEFPLPFAYQAGRAVTALTLFALLTLPFSRSWLRLSHRER